MNTAAPIYFHPKGVRNGRADHVTAKAGDSQPVRLGGALDIPGVWVTARLEGEVRNRRDPHRRPSQARTERIRTESESARSRKEVRGVRSTVEGGEHKPLEGRDSALMGLARKVSVRA